MRLRSDATESPQSTDPGAAMAENLIHTIQEVREIRDDVQAVNRLLSAGWVLLHTYSTTTDVDPFGHSSSESVYVLGRPSLDLR